MFITSKQDIVSRFAVLKVCHGVAYDCNRLKIGDVCVIILMIRLHKIMRRVMF